MPSDNSLLVAYARARLLDDYVYGIGMFDPAYPTHGTIRRCPFCGEPYRVHGGFSDHRDECEEGPCPGSNPAGVPDAE
jgi:hypothetical protein